MLRAAASSRGVCMYVCMYVCIYVYTALAKSNFKKINLKDLARAV